MSDVIKGTCLSMCPEKERWMREKKGILHRFEVDDKIGKNKRPTADPAKIVKCYTRPAAGQIMNDPDQLRPGPVLLSTIKYLFTKIVTKTDVDWIAVYDFVFDRLRSVRQDIVIQRINAVTSVELFEPIVRFLVYAAQRLCETSVPEFDAKINFQHLTECIKHLLILYDQLDKMDYYTVNRPEMEALYILLYIGNGEALTRALNLPLSIRSMPEVKLATRISLAWTIKNYVRVSHLIRDLPPILVCAFMVNLQTFRRTALKIMSSAYNSKQFTFPGLKLQEILLYRDIAKVEADCKLFNLTCANQNVLFQKATFKNDASSANSEMYYTPQTLHKFLPQILLESVQVN